MVKTRIRNHKRVFTWFASRRPQTPAEASLEASLKIPVDDYETDKIVFEVRALLEPQSALREPRLANRVMAMLAAKRDKPAFRRGESRDPESGSDQTRHEAIPAE
jgi:hypothetical protein